NRGQTHFSPPSPQTSGGLAKNVSDPDFRPDCRPDFRRFFGLDFRSEVAGVRREELRQRRVDLRVPGDDVAGLEVAVRAVEIADAAARLADDQRAGRDVPLAEPELPEP